MSAAIHISFQFHPGSLDHSYDSLYRVGLLLLSCRWWIWSVAMTFLGGFDWLTCGTILLMLRHVSTEQISLMTFFHQSFPDASHRQRWVGANDFRCPWSFVMSSVSVGSSCAISSFLLSIVYPCDVFALSLRFSLLRHFGLSLNIDFIGVRRNRNLKIMMRWFKAQAGHQLVH